MGLWPNDFAEINCLLLELKWKNAKEKRHTEQYKDSILWDICGSQGHSRPRLGLGKSGWFVFSLIIHFKGQCLKDFDVVRYPFKAWNTCSYTVNNDKEVFHYHVCSCRNVCIIIDRGRREDWADDRHQGLGLGVGEERGPRDLDVGVNQCIQGGP